MYLTWLIIAQNYKFPWLGVLIPLKQAIPIFRHSKNHFITFALQKFNCGRKTKAFPGITYLLCSGGLHCRSIPVVVIPDD